jgi:hypothetical protein
MNNILYSTEQLDNGLAHFVGFHDICPWNESNELLVIHQTVKDDIKERSKNDFINIMIWNPENNYAQKIDETNCWNWQQGSRLQWIPATNTIIFNKRIEGKAVAQKYNVNDSKFEEVINWPIYELHPSDKKALSYSFSRLGELWKGYGYADLDPEKDHNEIAPEENGIFEVDLLNNTRKLLISLNQTFEIGRKESFDKFKRFFTHCSYSPSGGKFCFFERFHTAEGALYSRFFVADSYGTNLKLISEGKQSHFDWYDDNHILIWSRPSKSLINKAHKLGVLHKPPFKQMIRFIRSLNPSLKSKMTNEYYRIIDVNNIESDRTIAREIIKEDGHPMFTQNRAKFVNDTYPNFEGEQELMIIDMNTNSKKSLCWFNVPEKFRDSDLKCDLHPRWNRTDDQICVDSSHSGKRQVYIVKAK